MKNISDAVHAQNVRDQLQAIRQEFEALISGSSESRSTVELDQSAVGRLSRMDALQGQQMALATDRRRALELKRIESALRRLEDGDYGYCVRCEEPITAKRLAFDPAVTLCVACAEEG
ncbi:MAG: TraR/DksA family transcriptional regulator [Alphaproteobacteria bacterium]|nr:TraR/DksA family transcriptional regulator [Alphaproteobacteria bacterium]